MRERPEKPHRLAPGGVNPEPTDTSPAALPGDVCSLLMTKTLQLNTHHRRSAFEEHFTADTAVFHCLCTMQCQGPDDDDVEPEKCRPGRGCYEGGPDLQ